MKKEFAKDFLSPLEDNFVDKGIYNDNDGFWYFKTGTNGIKVKAPFDLKVVSKSIIEGQSAELNDGYIFDSEYDSYKVVYNSLDDKYQFSISGILPNDKSKNIGREFRAGENIGVVLNKDSGVAWTFYELTIVNPEAPRKDQVVEYTKMTPDDIQLNTSESANAEKEAQAFKMPSKGTLFVVAVMALATFYIAKRYK